ncbi:MAG: ATP-binding cassette domain-containing protein [Chitinophagales bacterium]
MTDYIVKAEKLTKSFDKNVALNAIDITIPKGKIFGLLGPNGAGKTTFIRLITQIFGPDGGQLYFDGKSICKVQYLRYRLYAGRKRTLQKNASRRTIGLSLTTEKSIR